MGIKFSAVTQTQYNGMQRQAIINGGFSVNQRVVSGTVTLAAGAYGHDRWKAGASGCTYTFATVNNVTTITITAGSLIQVIEGNNLNSGIYTLSWSGTAQGKIGAGSFSTTGVTGTAVGGTNLNIEFNTGTISNAQFNIGSTALSFQPRVFTEELSLCRRYYEKSYAYTNVPANPSDSAGLYTTLVPSNTVATGQRYGTIRFSVVKRATPTITIYPFTTPSNTGRVSADSGVDLGSNSGGVGWQNDAGFVVYNNSGSSLTTANNTLVFHYTAEAEL